MRPPASLKDIQKFTGCLASLSRFVSRLGEKALPLYQLLKKMDKFTWMAQADAAFPTSSARSRQHPSWRLQLPRSP